MSKCLTPYVVDMVGYKQPVPCGRCPNCKKRTISSWSFRLMQQDKVSDMSLFITLTYDTRYVPITPKGFLGLCKRDLQLFFKRLRKRYHSLYVDGKPIKYFAVGEYGGKTLRPHYHVLLFNCPVELISPSWDKGHVHYGQVSDASVGYTLKYMMKPGKIPLHKNDDRHPEFRLMSKRIGISYLSVAMNKWHLSDLENRMYVNLEGGKKASMPRYYKDKLYTLEQRLVIAAVMKERMDEKDAKEMQIEFNKYGYMAHLNHKEAVRAAFDIMRKDSINSRLKI